MTDQTDHAQGYYRRNLSDRTRSRVEINPSALGNGLAVLTIHDEHGFATVALTAQQAREIGEAGEHIANRGGPCNGYNGHGSPQAALEADRG